MINEIMLKQYICESCNFICSKQSNYNTHILTRKHRKIIDGNSSDAKKIYHCHCGSTYKYASGYCRHKKTCNYVPPKETPVTEPKEPSPSLSETNWLEIIHMLVKENQEIRNLIVTQNNNLADQNKTITEFIKTHASGNTLTNSQNNNNIYNINMFLSEKCKDAQNMSDFIEVIKNKVDMFKIEENGYVNGISKLFIDELKSMEVTERPLHCTDERRSTFYVHNNDTWNKDEDLKDTKRAISHVSHANLRQCIDWSSNVPKSGSEREDHINRSIRLCKEAHKSGEDDKVEKIIRNISKEIPLNKQVISDVLV